MFQQAHFAHSVLRLILLSAFHSSILSHYSATIGVSALLLFAAFAKQSCLTLGVELERSCESRSPLGVEQGENSAGFAVHAEDFEHHFATAVFVLPKY